ncbi:3-hydroxybutyryl-CoA dehydrogenase [Aromatoleum bremense]|uniref:3-hydroxybutyryl-CoA dehydrogenase n=1 Tax=Aromatoleum bremense TaxID=76115 RepID=A0ABX1NQY4_9RHOO|nr:3-hydroxybutyryl-CoA dehydrogenase [Aromatoleum bremense]NMG14398.1 3-hydroxybutyryl-CoA dehydrogenase [Aromatoleum bremense]QTQ30727.1 3-hydroxybutanoyl-CoA dehydrogenase [Aromatoleum bremense]
MNMKKIGIVGAGTMGNGITQAFAVAGFDVVMSDVAEAALQRGLATLSGSLDRLIKKDKMTEAQKAEALARVSGSTDLGAMGDCDLIIEAATENLALKLKIFEQLDAIAKPDAIIASNTSSISITKLAASTRRADRIIGMHFFNPVPVMALVELIRGLQTSDATYAAVEMLARAVGKTPVQVRNSPGFVVNRLLCPMINEAIFALGEGLASAAEIDEAMKLGCNHPIGPLALGDMIGLDVELAVMQVLFEGFKDPKYRPAPLLVEMVEAGYLGRKSGKGFFEYK